MTGGLLLSSASVSHAVDEKVNESAVELGAAFAVERAAASAVERAAAFAVERAAASVVWVVTSAAECDVRVAWARVENFAVVDDAGGHASAAVSILAV